MGKPLRLRIRFSGWASDLLATVGWRELGANHVRSGDSVMHHFCLIENGFILRWKIGLMLFLVCIFKLL